MGLRSYESFVEALKAAGIRYAEELKKGKFSYAAGMATARAFALRRQSE